MDEILKRAREVLNPLSYRIITLCSKMELTETELLSILKCEKSVFKQHFTKLVDFRVLLQTTEKKFVYYRLNEESPYASVIDTMGDYVSSETPLLLEDRKNLDSVGRQRESRARDYFNRHASQWDKIRKLHINQEDLDQALLTQILTQSSDHLLDIGTGTGNVLELLSPYIKTGIGVDNSNEMLNSARDNLAKNRILNCQVQQADMYQLPFSEAHFDVICLQMVLHYAYKPLHVLKEAVRVLKPKGRLFLVDFASHDHQALKETYAHRWLGFSEHYINTIFRQADLKNAAPVSLLGNPLTIMIWCGVKTAFSDSQKANDALFDSNSTAEITANP